MLKLSSPQLLRLRRQYLTLLGTTMLIINVIGFVLVGISFSESATESLLKIDAENGNIGWTAQKNTVGKIVSLRVELPKGGGR